MSQDLSHIVEPLRGLAVPVASLTPDPKNARRHSERNLASIKASLERFGFREPLVVQKQGMIVRSGNGRLEVSKRLGWTHVPAVVVDEADVDAAAFALADNRTAELAEWDYGALFEAINDITTTMPDFSLDDIGWSDGDIKALELEILVGDRPSMAGIGGAEGKQDGYAIDPEPASAPVSPSPSPASLAAAPAAPATEAPALSPTMQAEADSQIRRLMLYMSTAEYHEVIDLLAKAMEDLGTSNHSETVHAVLKAGYGG